MADLTQGRSGGGANGTPAPDKNRRTGGYAPPPATGSDVPGPIGAEEQKDPKAAEWRRALSVVEIVLELDPATRLAYLETLGSHSEALRRRVLKVLRSMGALGPDDEPTEAGAGSASPPGEDRIGPWRLMRMLGRGGMGAVFLA